MAAGSKRCPARGDVRARVRLLPNERPVARIVSEVDAAGVETWWSHSAAILWTWGIQDIDIRDVTSVARSSPDKRRALAGKYRTRTVVPRIEEQERAWAESELAKLQRVTMEMA